MKDAAGTTDYTYDIQGRLIQETRTIGTYAHTVSYDYDGAATCTRCTTRLGARSATATMPWGG